MKKGLKITIGILAVLFALIFAFLGVYYLWPWNKDFFDNATQEFEIPGLDTSFVPQGFTEIESYNKYLISGYMNDGSPSRFYVIDSDTKKVDNYFILDIDGKKFDGHAGGVVSYGSTLWVVSQLEEKGYALRFLLSDVMNLKGSGYAISVRDYFETYNNADFAFTYDDMLWVGEFYRDDNYLTNTDHHVKTRSGETNHSIVFGFDIDESYNYGLDDDFPVKAISVPDLAQGMEVTSSGNIVLSTSYSIPDSNIYYYKNILDEASHAELRVGLDSVPLWFLDGKSLISSRAIPAMSEEMIIKNDRVYILFESACKKYRLFNRKRLNHVYSLPLTYFEK